MRIASGPMLAMAAVVSLSVLCSTCGATQPNLGTFKVNGKDASLGYAALVAMNPVEGAPRVILVLAEQAPATGTDPAAASDSGSLGPSVSAPILDMSGQGWSAIAGFNYLHPAAKNGHGWCRRRYLHAQGCRGQGRSIQRSSGYNGSPATSGDSIVLDVPLKINMPRFSSSRAHAQQTVAALR